VVILLLSTTQAQWWRNLFQSGSTSARQKTVEKFFHQAIYFNSGPNTNCVA